MHKALAEPPLKSGIERSRYTETDCPGLTPASAGSRGHLVSGEPPFISCISRTVAAGETKHQYPLPVGAKLPPAAQVPLSRPVGDTRDRIVLDASLVGHEPSHAPFLAFPLTEILYIARSCCTINPLRKPACIPASLAVLPTAKASAGCKPRWHPGTGIGRLTLNIACRASRARKKPPISTLLISTPTPERQFETHTHPMILSSRLDPGDARRGPQVLTASRLSCTSDSVFVIDTHCASSTWVGGHACTPSHAAVTSVELRGCRRELSNGKSAIIPICKSMGRDAWLSALVVQQRIARVGFCGPLGTLVITSC